MEEGKVSEMAVQRLRTRVTTRQRVRLGMVHFLVRHDFISLTSSTGLPNTLV